MGPWIDKILELLLARVWNLLSGRVVAQVELELAATQAELLEQAAAWRRDHAEIGERVAVRLETACERLAAGALPLDGALEPSGAAAKPTLRIKSAGARNDGAEGKRPRGRPKKSAELGEPEFPHSDQIEPSAEVVP